MSDSSIFDEAFYKSRLRMVHLERAAYGRGRVVRAVLNPDLSDARKEILRQDFALKNDVLLWETTAAMEIYARHHIESLASPKKRGKLVPWFSPG